MNKTNILLKVVSIIIGLGIGLTVFILVAKDLGCQGKLVMQTDFLQFTPYFSILKPQDRIVMSDVNYLKAEPIYFDLYMPRDFDKAKVDMEYKNEYGYAISVGPNMKEGWDLKSLEDLPAASNDYKINSAEFDLASANINNGKLRFIISIPELQDENKGILLKKVSVSMTRKTIWQDNIKQNLLNYLKYVKNQF